MASPRALRGAAHPRLLTVAELLVELDNDTLRLEPDRTGAPEWPEHRKRLLLDSVLRGWPIGSVYVAVSGQSRTVVDGGQRLTALSEFVAGKIDLDGRLAPRDELLREADGKTYGELPSGLRSAFDDYPLVVVEFHGLASSELRPALFRLNDTDQLSATQRTVIESGAFGEQVRGLIVEAVDWGLTNDHVGFSNAGLAYEDTLGRVILATEYHDLRAAATESALVRTRVEDGQPAPADVYEEVSAALRTLLTLPAVDEPAVRFGKATLTSWLLLLVHAKRRFGPTVEPYVGYLMDWFEPQRRRLAAGLESDLKAPVRGRFVDLPTRELLSVFNERAAVEPMSVESLEVRDMILWLFLVGIGGAPTTKTTPVPLVLEVYGRLSPQTDLDGLLADATRSDEWGRWE